MIYESQADMPELNATMRKFGAPQTVIRYYQHWTVMLRPAQATLGALVLAAHDPVRNFSALCQQSFNELHEITAEIESALSRAFNYDKLNYLMLMMVDPDVHFHVIPRYAGPRQFAGLEFTDPGWPGVPDLGHVNETGTEVNLRIIDHLKACWEQPGA